MDNPYRYRNKADFKVDKNGNIGYFKRGGSNDLIPIDRCIIQRESTDEIINDFKKYFKENGNEGIKDIIVRTTKSGETMVIVVTQTEGTGLFVWNQIKGTGLNIVSVYQNINPKNNSTVLGYKI